LDTTTLRWILIVIGVVIVASIFLFGNPDQKRKPKASRVDEGEARGGSAAASGRRERREPTLDGGGNR
jgi:hypothetical protein